LRNDAAADAGLRCGDEAVESSGGAAGMVAVEAEGSKCENHVDMRDGNVPGASEAALG
jgi:hypothetical protein